MHFHQLLIASLLVLPSFFLSISAAPFKRNPGLVTLPLKRHSGVDHLHPLVRHQVRVNRAIKRLARFTGRQIDSALLERNLHKRLLDVYGSLDIAKRYFVPSQSLADTNSSSGAIGGPAAVQAEQNNSISVATNPVTKDSLGLDIQDLDVAYLMTIQIGNPAADYLVIADSGSSDFWVGSTTCTTVAIQNRQILSTNQNCGNHQFLGKTTSSSFIDTKQPFNVTYGTGFVIGDIVQYDVTIAGLTLKGHQFGVAKGETIDFSGQASDGLMGLGLHPLSQQNVSTPPESLKSNGLINSNVVSFKLGRVEDKTNDGEITFGGLDPTKFNSQSAVVLANNNTLGFWEVTMTDVTIDGQSLNIQTTAGTQPLGSRPAILDTGTTLMIIPPDDALALNNAIPGGGCDQSGTCAVPCNTNSTVALTFGNQSFAINPVDLTHGAIDNTFCLSGIQPGDPGNDGATWLLGDTFLKNVYFSANTDTFEVMLANLA